MRFFHNVYEFLIKASETRPNTIEYVNSRSNIPLELKTLYKKANSHNPSLRGTFECVLFNFLL
jgi:hypothetical protein